MPIVSARHLHHQCEHREPEVMNQRTCLNQSCSRTFQTIDDATLCPKCETEGFEKISTTSEPSLAEITCLNPYCKKTFTSTTGSGFCSDCQKEAKLDDHKNAQGLSPIVCLAPECKKIFYGDGQSLLCPICKKIAEKAQNITEDEAYQKIRRYVESHPNATIDEIHIITHVPIEKIKKLIEEGHFQLIMVPKCTRCGAMMPNARLSESVCHQCVQNLRHQMQQSATSLRSASPTQSLSSSKERKYGFGRN